MRFNRLRMVAVAMGFAASVEAQQVIVPADTMIRLQRTSCYGECPIYTVTIDARGNVTYEGERFVRVIGRQTAQIAQAAVAKLLESAERIRFFDLRDSYNFTQYRDGRIGPPPTDNPTKIVTITVNGRTKRIENYYGAPAVLTEFEREIDSTAHTVRWIFLDEDTLEAFRLSGWSASTDEGATFLQKAVERDDVAVVRMLIEMGGNLNGPPNRRISPLLLARSSSMVNLLASAGADPNARPAHNADGSTPLLATWYKDASVTEALLKAGARPDDSSEGRTALWHAACRGKWRLVTMLLDAGADPRGSAKSSALECSREARGRELERQRLGVDHDRAPVEDFDRVITLLEAAENRRNR